MFSRTLQEKDSLGCSFTTGHEWTPVLSTMPGIYAVTFLYPSTKCCDYITPALLRHTPVQVTTMQALAKMSGKHLAGASRCACQHKHPMLAGKQAKDESACLLRRVMGFQTRLLYTKPNFYKSMLGLLTKSQHRLVFN